MAERKQMPLQFVGHTLATGFAPDGGESVFILVGDAPQESAVWLACPHTCDTFIENLREARAAVWPHPTGQPDESDEFDAEQVTPGVEVTFVGGKAQGPDPLPYAEVERAVARHKRAARMLWKWLDAASAVEER